MKEIRGYTASGGGSKGAWGGGVSEYLINNLNRNYEHLSGTSTGSLMIGLVSLKKIELLKSAYTSVNNKDIYTLAPYTVRKQINGVFKTKLNYWNIIKNTIFKRQKTFGDSSRLRDIILPKFFSSDDYETSRSLKKELIVGVTNLTKGQTEYYTNLEDGMTYNDFLDWTFASTCAAPFMSIIEKNGSEYVDGAYLEHTPIQELINKGCTNKDVIIHKTPEIEVIKSKNPLQVTNRIIDIMLFQNSSHELNLAKLKAKDVDVILNIYKLDKKLTNNSLSFNKDLMNEWWELGYNFAMENKAESWRISKRKKPRKIEEEDE